MTKISGQPNNTSPASADYLLGNAASGPTTKRFTLANLITFFFNNIPAGVITNSKLSTTTGELGGAWSDWTPTWTILTIGDAVQACKYTRIGNTIIGRISVVLGSTSAMGTGVPTFTLPVPAVSQAAAMPFGPLRINAGSANACGGIIRFSDTTHGDIVQASASGSNVLEAGFSSSSPGAWGAGKSIYGTFTYEAAP